MKGRRVTNENNVLGTGSRGLGDDIFENNRFVGIHVEKQYRAELCIN